MNSKKIFAFGASNSVNSINRKFAMFTASLFNTDEIYSLDLSKIEIPLYSKQLEEKNGIPSEVLFFANQIDVSDLLILSLAENNGSFNAAFKNLIDWCSRIKDRKIFGGKPMVLLATSPGARGGSSVLENAKNLFPHQGAIILNTFSLPSFHENFEEIRGVTNKELLDSLKQLVSSIN